MTKEIDKNSPFKIYFIILYLILDRFLQKYSVPEHAKLNLSYLVLERKKKCFE
jgi:hypothetical protein